MKILIIHGEDTISSDKFYRDTISQSRKKGWEIRELDVRVSVRVSLDTGNLFNDKLLYILKNPTENDLNLNINLNLFLLVYSDKALPATYLKQFPKETTIKRFDFPKDVFTFIESFYPGNSDNCIKLFHKTINHNPSEMIFALLSRQVRDLFWIISDPKSAEFPPWRASKLKSQASKFGNQKLRSIIKKLSDIDIAVKTSKGDLTHLLDLMIVRDLE